MDADTNVRVVLEVFAAIEQRDAARFLAHTHPQVSICWPPSLPWNDGLPGHPDKHGHHARSWLEVWAPLQPTAAERQMHPEVIAAADDRVVVRWHQRGRSPTGLDLTARCWACTRSNRSGWPAPRCSISTPTRSNASSPTRRNNNPQGGPPGRPGPADEPRRAG